VGILELLKVRCYTLLRIMMRAKKKLVPIQVGKGKEE
jgi:hypothetical protein